MPNFLLGVGIALRSLMLGITMYPPLPKLSKCVGLVAPLAGDDEVAFARLQEYSSQIQSPFPQANWISAGMSGDFATALKYGATHLRIGSSILGNRGFQG